MDKQIKRRTLHEDIVDKLVDMILTGELSEGEKINENTLVEAMGISKTPLREALRVLRAEGLVELIPQRGSFVAKPSLDEIQDMFAIMAVLEGFCAREALGKTSTSQHEELRRKHYKLEEAYLNNDQKAYLVQNNKFHSLLQEIAGNEILNQMISGLRRRILLFRFKTLNLPGRFERSITEHREIIESFAQGDPDLTEAVMRRHLMSQAAALRELEISAAAGGDRVLGPFRGVRPAKGRAPRRDRCKVTSQAVAGKAVLPRAKFLAKDLAI